jgi:cytochrome c peroxidase
MWAERNNTHGIVLVAACCLAIGSTSGATAQGASASPAQITAMKSEYRRPAPRPIENKALVDLGRQLFWDSRISASGNSACVGCHFPYLGWAVTDQRSRNDSGKPTSRRAQPLIGAGYIAAQVGWDGRSASLEAQAKSSIATGSMSMRETDTPVKVEVIEERIRNIAEYRAMFHAALPNAPIDLDSIVKAIATYERTIEPGIAPFDRWIEGDESAISESAKRGFVLFNADANCFVCHSGWRFTDDKFHDIGTTTTDLGRGRELKNDEDMQFAFKTPTLRSVALRPPYMHNGSSIDLYEAVKHYEKPGIERPSRSPLLVRISLTEQQRLDLVAFLQTLTGIPEGETQPQLPGKN